MESSWAFPSYFCAAAWFSIALLGPGWPWPPLSHFLELCLDWHPRGVLWFSWHSPGGSRKPGYVGGKCPQGLSLSDLCLVLFLLEINHENSSDYLLFLNREFIVYYTCLVVVFMVIHVFGPKSNTHIFKWKMHWCCMFLVFWVPYLLRF